MKTVTLCISGIVFRPESPWPLKLDAEHATVVERVKQPCSLWLTIGGLSSWTGLHPSLAELAR
jgi:hypothetical protein